MGDWTKEGVWKSAHLYIYGFKREFFHLVFYMDTVGPHSIYPDQEFDITEIISDLNVIKMLYPVVNDVDFNKMYNGWCDYAIPCGPHLNIAVVTIEMTGRVNVSYMRY